jgi:RNA polymerase sigma-70 factor (ECF subfamily)
MGTLFQLPPAARRSQQAAAQAREVNPGATAEPAPVRAPAVLTLARKRPPEDEASRDRFERLVLPHLDAAYNLARWLAGDDDSAGDVAQAALLRAFQFRDGLRGEDARPWLLAIVRNTFFTVAKAAKRAALAHEEYDDEIHGNLPEAADALFQRPLSPETALLAQADRDRLRTALEKLPVVYREVIVLRELEDLAYKEIARVLDVPTGTVMSRLARGRRLLAAHLLEGGKES